MHSKHLGKPLATASSCKKHTGGGTLERGLPLTNVHDARPQATQHTSCTYQLARPVCQLVLPAP